MKRVEKFKENIAKELVTMAAKVHQAKTYNEAYDLWKEFSNKSITDLTAGKPPCHHCSQVNDHRCDGNCSENCKEWFEEEVED